MTQDIPSTIAERLLFAHQQIRVFCENSQRSHADVQLLAVSKTKPVDAIIQAHQAGQRAFGENYVQEGVDKIQQLTTLADIEWHFIGPLQSNKTRLVAEHFDWCQSVDRLKIAQRLSQQRPSTMPPLNLCIQINIDREETKSGIMPDELPEIAEHIAQLPNVTLRGIMAIPAAEHDSAQRQQSFNHLKQLFQQLQLKFEQVDTLSLGMSGDLQDAIAAGSTMVRIGTAIFGAREKK